MNDVRVYPSPQAFLDKDPRRKLDRFGVQLGGMDFGDKWNRVADADAPQGHVVWHVSYMVTTGEVYAEQCVLNRSWAAPRSPVSPDEAREVWLFPVTFANKDAALAALLPLERGQREPDSLLRLAEQLGAMARRAVAGATS